MGRGRVLVAALVLVSCGADPTVGPDPCATDAILADLAGGRWVVDDSPNVRVRLVDVAPSPPRVGTNRWTFEVDFLENTNVGLVNLEWDLRHVDGEAATSIEPESVDGWPSNLSDSENFELLRPGVWEAETVVVWTTGKDDHRSHRETISFCVSAG